MISNKVTIKYKWSTSQGHEYHIVLNGQYDKVLVVTNKECMEQRVTPEDMIQVLVTEEMSKLGISQDNFTVSVL